MQSNRLLLEAIALRKCVNAVYNRMAVKLAPHILFTRHDEIYLDAVTVERDGQPPREAKLGTFKLTGLHDLKSTDLPFEPIAGFDARDPKYGDAALFSLET